MHTALIYTYIAAFVVFAIPFIALAQIPISGASSGSIQLSNQFPEPNTTIQATISGQSASGVRWFLNNNEISNQPGERSIQVPIGNAGSVHLLQVRRGNDVLDELIIRPIYIDIGVETDSLTAPDYTGTPAAGIGGNVRLTALVTEQSRLNDPGRYEYHWRINGRTFGGGPIRDHQIQATVPNARQMIVELQVIQPDVGQIGSQTMIVPIKEPEVLFYVIHSLYGLLPYTLPEIGPRARIQDIFAVPYHTPTRTLQRGDVTWMVDNLEVPSITNRPLTINPASLGAFPPSTIRFELFDVESLHSASGVIRLSN